MPDPMSDNGYIASGAERSNEDGSTVVYKETTHEGIVAAYNDDEGGHIVELASGQLVGGEHVVYNITEKD